MTHCNGLAGRVETATMEFSAIIPALDEEQTIGDVVAMVLTCGATSVVVVDNGSSDETASRARAAGAKVIHEPRKGYGRACLTGIEMLAANPPPWVLFCDGDGSDDPIGMKKVLQAARTNVDFVIGNRANKFSEVDALTPVQRFGNRLSCGLIKLLYRTRFHDLGPMRAIRWTTLQKFKMKDEGFGWTVEMQIKAAKQGVRFCEVDVRARRRRGGQSKISGTVKGSVMAGSIILSTIFRQVLSDG